MVTVQSKDRSGFAKTRRKAALATARLLKFRNEEKGATAVEFAMVALPFVFGVLSLMELALVFLIASTLNNALDAAARGIKTGANIPPNAAQFVALTCSNMGWLQSTCSSQLQVDVRTETQFSSPSEPDPMQTGTFNPAVLTYTPGTAGQIILVRAFYQWPLILPIMDAALSKARNGVAVIVATTTFVNEPYTS